MRKKHGNSTRNKNQVYSHNGIQKFNGIPTSGEYWEKTSGSKDTHGMKLFM